MHRGWSCSVVLFVACGSSPEVGSGVDAGTDSTPDAAGPSVCEALASTACVATGFCDPACAADLPLCIANAQVARLSCTVPTAATGDRCADNATTASFGELGPLLGGSNAVECGDPLFSRLGPMLTFQDLLTVESFALDSWANQAETCQMEMVWTGQAAFIGGPAPIVGAMAVPLSNNTTAVIAVEVKFTLDCDAPMTCDFAMSPGDDAATCAGLAAR